MNVWERIGWEQPDDPVLQVDKERTLREGYTWIPAGLSSEKVSVIQKLCWGGGGVTLHKTVSSSRRVDGCFMLYHSRRLKA